VLCSGQDGPGNGCGLYGKHGKIVVSMGYLAEINVDDGGPPMLAKDVENYADVNAEIAFVAQSSGRRPPNSAHATERFAWGYKGGETQA
jgi:hypothetical protein